MGDFQKRRRHGSLLLLLLFFLVLFYIIQQMVADRSPSWSVAILMTISVIGLMLVAAGIVVYQATVWVMHGERCPGCLKGGMKRVGMVSFGPRYYYCSHCDQTWQRKMLGVWDEVEKDELAALRASQESTDPIGPEPWQPVKTDEAGHAVDSLVLSQRRRKDGD